MSTVYLLFISSFWIVGVSTLDNYTISLVVSSLASGEEVVVYLTLNNRSYPLGLLPGHMIRLHNVERKVSRHGSMYCQYVVISSVQVLDTVTQQLDRYCTQYLVISSVQILDTVTQHLDRYCTQYLVISFVQILDTVTTTKQVFV
jgi:DNA-directed RNA polymerase subunit N (RpoN/RPB10)